MRCLPAAGPVALARDRGPPLSRTPSGERADPPERRRPHRRSKRASGSSRARRRCRCAVRPATRTSPRRHRGTDPIQARGPPRRRPSSGSRCARRRIRATGLGSRLADLSRSARPIRMCRTDSVDPRRIAPHQGADPSRAVPAATRTCRRQDRRRTDSHRPTRPALWSGSRRRRL